MLLLSSSPKPLARGLGGVCEGRPFVGEEFGSVSWLCSARECTDRLLKELLIMWLSSTPIIMASSSNGASSSGSGLGGRCICGVHDSASTMGLKEVDRRCGRICRAAADANVDSNGLRAGKEDATGVGTLSRAKVFEVGLRLRKLNEFGAVGERTGDSKSFERALPIRIGVGGGCCLGEPVSISMSVAVSPLESTLTRKEPLLEVLELLCGRKACC